MRSKSRKAKMNALPPGPISGAILIWNAKDTRIRKDVQGTLKHAELASAIASEPKYARRGGLSAEKRIKRARPHVIGTTGCPERFSTALTRSKINSASAAVAGARTKRADRLEDNTVLTAARPEKRRQKCKAIEEEEEKI